MEALSLKDTDFLSFPSLSKLLANFSATLESLILYECLFERSPVAVEQTVLAPGTPLPLPHLHTLDLRISTASISDDVLLRAFAPCPLQHLTLHITPDTSPIGRLDFLKSHFGTLHRVTIKVGRSTHLWAAGLVASFAALCEVKGIECAVVWPPRLRLDVGEDSDFTSESDVEDGDEDSEEDSEEDRGSEQDDEMPVSDV